MSRARELGLLLRQLTAHDAFVARRALREGVALALARTGRRLPGAAALAARVQPSLAEAQQVLALRAEHRGDAEAAAHHRAAAQRLTRNTTETSVLATLRNTLAWRGARRARGGTPPRLEALLAAGSLDAAERELERGDLSAGTRVDGLLRLARCSADAGRGARCAALLETACRVDGGRADVWRARGERALSDGRLPDAREALERSVALDRHDAGAWLALGNAWESEDGGRAEASWSEALRRDPDCDAALLSLERSHGEAAPGREPRLRVAGPLPTAPLEVGAELRVELELALAGGPGALWVLEPFGAGLHCEPCGRLPVAAGEQRVALHVRALRPDAANAGRPWRLTLALCAGDAVARVRVELSVSDPAPGRLYAVVTEDHELYDERESFGPELARTTLVDKSRLAEAIANREGAPWTHVVDVGSLALVAWAAERSPAAWQPVDEAHREHLVDAVAGGNDLALHCHAFHDPATAVFCHGFDAETDRVTTSSAFLEAGIPERGFWSRAFPTLGGVDEPGSRAWATWRGIGMLEALGRLGDPRFRVTLFRAGSFDFGGDAAERRRSIALLQSLGVLADSDVPKPRLYHRPMARSTYPIGEDPREPAPDAAAVRLLEIRPEYNLEADFLSDTGVLNRYVDGRVAAARRNGDVAAGVHVVCAMTHDKFINWRMERRWDALEADYGDWATIRDHLRHQGVHGDRLERATVREAVLEWYERYTPSLLAWRDEEIVVLGPPGASLETFRYAIRLLGREFPLTPERPEAVEVHLPAWLHGRVRDAWIERDGRRVEARPPPAGAPRLAFRVDSRDAGFELVVEAEPGDGIQAEPHPERPGALRLRARHGYRRATVEVPAELAPGGVRRRVRDVALRAAATGYEGALPADDEATAP